MVGAYRRWRRRRRRALIGRLLDRRDQVDDALRAGIGDADDTRLSWARRRLQGQIDQLEQRLKEDL